MAHPYTTAARVREFAAAQNVDHLIDLDGDGLADAGVLDGKIERACNEIDSRLGFRFVVPFASLPGTPGKISDIADRLALFYMLEPVGGTDRAETRRHWEIAQAELDRLANGDAYIDAPSISTQARRPVRYDTTRDCKYHGI